jgi:hypothetical protein
VLPGYSGRFGVSCQQLDTCTGTHLLCQDSPPRGQAHDVPIGADGRVDHWLQGDRINEAWQWVVCVKRAGVITRVHASLAVPLVAGHARPPARPRARGQVAMTELTTGQGCVPAAVKKHKEQRYTQSVLPLRKVACTCCRHRSLRDRRPGRRCLSRRRRVDPCGCGRSRRLCLWPQSHVVGAGQLPPWAPLAQPQGAPSLEPAGLPALPCGLTCRTCRVGFTYTNCRR